MVQGTVGTNSQEGNDREKGEIKGVSEQRRELELTLRHVVDCSRGSYLQPPGIGRSDVMPVSIAMPKFICSHNLLTFKFNCPICTEQATHQL